VVQAGGTLDPGRLLFMALLGCQVSAAAGLAWLLGWRCVGGGPLLAVQARLGLAGVVLLAALLFPALMTGPANAPSAPYQVFGGWPGWLALALAGAAALGHAWVARPRSRIHVLGLVVLTAGVLGASGARRWDLPNPGGFWAAYHVLAGF